MAHRSARRRIRPNPELTKTIVHRMPIWKMALLLGMRHSCRLSTLMNSMAVPETDHNVRLFTRMAEAVDFHGDVFLDQVAASSATETAVPPAPEAA